MKYWIGGYIREARLKKGLSQAQLGGLVGFVQSYISMVENKRRDPGYHAVVLMAHVLEMPLPAVHGLLPASAAQPGTPPEPPTAPL